VDAARLKEIDMFASFPQEDLDRLAGVADEVSIQEGETLVRAGTPPDQLFFIEEGTVEVRRDDDVVAKLGAGDVVGERGVLERGLRNATVVATSPVRAVFLTGDQLRQLEHDHPELDERLRSIIDEREG
jgi:CRP/FNR family transcriptional regulator, cyclic AMP receptor protein